MAIRVFYCPYTEQDGALASHIWHNYRFTHKGTVQMRLNLKDCLVAMDGLDVTDKLLADKYVEEFDIGSIAKPTTQTIDKLSTWFNVSAEKIASISSTKDLAEKMIKRHTPSFDIPTLKKMVTAGRMVHIDLINSEMDL